MVGYNVVILYYIYNLLLVIFIANKIVHENTNAILKKKKKLNPFAATNCFCTF